MNMIENHMEQIALSATAISELPFPAPRIFTNALLHPHDITALIRDVEVHERALFKPLAPEPGSREFYARRQTRSGTGGGSATASANARASSSTAGHATTLATLNPSAAVGRILGSEMLTKIRRNEKLAAEGGPGAAVGGAVDIELLLEGAERLSTIYPIHGAKERIQTLRERHDHLTRSVAFYEEKVAEQSVLLDRVHLHHAARSGMGGESGSKPVAEQAAPLQKETRRRESYVPEDFEREEVEMRELEAKRRRLQERVQGMQRDLGGLKR